MIGIEKVSLSVIKMSLKSPFENALEKVTEREAILLEVLDKEGVAGFGEAVAFSTPWYTEETVQTCFHMLKDVLVPLLREKPVAHPKEVSGRFRSVRRNHMAKAAIETAIWDLYAKKKQKPLWRLIGGARDRVDAGVAVGSHDTADALRQIGAFVDEGYKRVKVKIKPGHDEAFIREIRHAFPDLALMADANSAYTLEDAPRLKRLDRYGLLMIEQPLAADDIVEHAALQKQLETPVCLDESIVTYHDAESALRLGSFRVLNIKIGRVGGLYPAIRLHDLCASRGIPVWCGGMIEFGVSRAFNLALASLPGFTIPGDISSSSRFWEKDIIEPEITVENGQIRLPDRPGTGFEIDRAYVEKTRTYTETI
ncbi:o-succinylbenzoate synthase [Heyndrickxia coagulans]|uniref:o-succinylbenzoate synthase n=1 Tax=Heyndrickxia coagulans TaxID=1398 RepID=UPI001A946FE1|nr:o-succinylbenzoate synthase [Heyndrickxia coagulans]